MGKPLPIVNPSPIAPFLGAKPGLRFHEVLDDQCAPEIMPRDFVLIAPVSEWHGDGYYIVSDYFGTPCIFKCCPAGSVKDRKIKLIKTNPLWPSEPEIVPYAEFRDRVLGKVAMTCKMRDQSLLQEL